jgi:hypothetical protein
VGQVTSSAPKTKPKKTEPAPAPLPDLTPPGESGEFEYAEQKWRYTSPVSFTEIRQLRMLLRSTVPLLDVDDALATCLTTHLHPSDYVTAVKRQFAEQGTEGAFKLVDLVVEFWGHCANRPQVPS